MVVNSNKKKSLGCIYEGTPPEFYRATLRESTEESFDGIFGEDLGELLELFEDLQHFLDKPIGDVFVKILEGNTEQLH